MPLADGLHHVGGQGLEHDTAVDLPTQNDFLPIAAVVDRAEDEVMAFGLQRADQTVDHLGIDAFEDPGVVGVQEADAAGPAAGKRPRPQVRPIAHLAGDLPHAFGRLGTAAVRLAVLAAKNASDRRARHPGAFRNLVDGDRHERILMVGAAAPVRTCRFRTACRHPQNRLDCCGSQRFAGPSRGDDSQQSRKSVAIFPAASRMLTFDRPARRWRNVIGTSAKRAFVRARSQRISSR